MTTDILSKFPEEIVQSIFDILPRKDIYNAMFVNKRLHESAIALLLKNVHIILKPKNKPLEDSKFLEDIDTYFSSIAPTPMYPNINASNLKHITVLTSDRKILSCLRKIQSCDKSASYIRSFTVEIFQVEDKFGIPHNIIEDTILNYNIEITQILSYHVIYSRLKCCYQMSLPIEFIPLNTHGCFKGGRINSFTLSSSPIREKYYYDDQIHGFSHLELLACPDSKVYYKSIFEIYRICDKFQAYKKECTKKVQDTDVYSQFCLILKNATKLSNFLEVCATDCQINSVFFNGFTHFHRYCGLLTSVNRGFLKEILNIDISRSLESVVKFSSRCTSGNNSFGYFSAHNSELKYFHYDNFSLADFFKYVSGFCQTENTRFRFSHLAIHYNREDFEKYETAHWDITRLYDNYKTIAEEYTDLKYLVNGEDLKSFKITWRYMEEFMRREVTLSKPDKAVGETSEKKQWSMVYPVNAFIAKEYNESIYNEILANHQRQRATIATYRKKDYDGTEIPEWLSFKWEFS